MSATRAYAVHGCFPGQSGLCDTRFQAPPPARTRDAIRRTRVTREGSTYGAATFADASSDDHLSERGEPSPFPRRCDASPAAIWRLP